MSVPEQTRTSVDHIAHQLDDEAKILTEWAGGPLRPEDEPVLHELINDRNERFSKNAKELGDRVMSKVTEANPDVQQRRELQDHNVR